MGVRAMSHFTTRISVLLSFVGVIAFGIGVIAGLMQGGLISICFVVALSSGLVALLLDGVKDSKRVTARSKEVRLATDPSTVPNYQASH